MCGIIGYIGSKNATNIIMKGLKRIEYRGYDSAGVCVVNSTQTLNYQKTKGGVSTLQKLLDTKPMPHANAGIGHTRWATHGEPSTTNAHPHVGQNFALVHNGIVENFQELKDQLITKNKLAFKSETDSEVLLQLIEQAYASSHDPKMAISSALKQVRGSFGLAILYRANPDTLYVARRGSPIVIGESGKSIHASSDTSTLPSSVKKVSFLEDDQMAILRPGKIEIFDFDHNRKIQLQEDFTSSRNEATRGVYKHYLLKEIMEQPESLQETLRGRIKKGRAAVVLGGFTLEPSKVKRLTNSIGIGCGTAYYSILLNSYISEHITDVRIDGEMASEFIYRKRNLNPKTTLGQIVSQSGETADTLAALSKLNSHDIHTHGIVNVIGSSIARQTRSGTYLYAGPEISVASTKAFTSQVVAQLILSLRINEMRGHPLANNQAIIDELATMPDAIRSVLGDIKHDAKQIAKQVYSYQHAMFLGRNDLFPVALEGALKLKEISYMQTEAHPSGEMKHGPLALIDDKMLVFYLVKKGELYEKSLSNLHEIDARGGNTVVITDSETLANERKHAILIKHSHPFTNALLFNLPLQLLAYHIANYRKLPIDKPRNLAKSVTVE